MGDQGMEYVPRPDDDAAVIGARAAPCFLHAGRILMIGGCLVLTYTTTGNHPSHAEHALVGLALLLLSVLLIMLTPAANRLPRAAGAAAAVADAVLFYFLAPGNYGTTGL